MLTGYDKLVSEQLALYLRNSRVMNDLVLTQVRIIRMAKYPSLKNLQAELVESLFIHQRQFLSSSCSGSLASAGSGLRQAEDIKRIQNIASKNVRHTWLKI